VPEKAARFIVFGNG